MRAELVQRLKALGADDRKIKALEGMFSEATIARLVDQLEHTDKEAARLGIAYKGAKMSKFPDFDELDRGFDILDRVMKARGPGAALEVARAMVRTGADLESGRAVVKEGKATYKQAYTPALADALKAALMGAGEAAVVETLRALAATSGNGRETLASSGEQSTATKAAQRDPYAQAVQAGPPRGWRPN